MTDILIMMATLMVALVWVILLQRRVTTTLHRLEIAERRRNSAQLTLRATKTDNEELTAEVAVLKQILLDVAKGEANVWIEDGELRAARTAAGNTSVH
jgi:cell division protein FtsB